LLFGGEINILKSTTFVPIVSDDKLPVRFYLNPDELLGILSTGKSRFQQIPPGSPGLSAFIGIL